MVRTQAIRVAIDELNDHISVGPTVTVKELNKIYRSKHVPLATEEWTQLVEDREEQGWRWRNIDSYLTLMPPLGDDRLNYTLIRIKFGGDRWLPHWITE